MAEYIERKKAMMAVINGLAFHVYAGDTAAKIISDIPAADVKPVVRGGWTWDGEGYHCSECFFRAYGNTGEILSGAYNFCPNCGADMRGNENDV